MYTFCREYDHNVFDKNEMLLVLFSRVNDGYQEPMASKNKGE